MAIESVAAWVTVVSAPAAVVGVGLVWLQLVQMKRDQLKVEKRQIAAILPSLSVLRTLVDVEWGCEIIDARDQVPQGELLDRLASAVDSDISLLALLQTKCADVGLHAVVLAATAEGDLQIMRY